MASAPLPKHVSTFFPRPKLGGMKVPPAWQVARCYKFLGGDLKATCFALRLSPDTVRMLIQSHRPTRSR